MKLNKKADREGGKASFI